MLRRPSLVLVVLTLLAASCGGGTEPTATPSPTGGGDTFPVTLVDDEGVEATVEREPRRIVTFAPSMTEILFALGIGDRIVGVSGGFDDFPAEAQEIEGVGGAGEFGVDPNEEVVVDLEPDLMLTAFFGGEWKDRLRGAGVPVFTAIAEGFDDSLADIERVGALTGTAAEAASLADGMRAEAEQIEAAAGERVTCFFEVSFEGGFFTVGPGALEYELLERAGCDPVTSGAKDAYPEWSVEALVEADPEVYLVAEESGGTLADISERPGFGDLAAVTEGRVALIDSDLVSRPGPRLVQGLRVLAEALDAA